ncbi:nitroreductase [Celerinatantimonas sp. YJH-8]|uniref:nitroreductase n=1 Tax=Celerinatantimonas sp. YJH-8 TaxID=3228714 RepID=UPI0038C60B0F
MTNGHPMGSCRNCTLSLMQRCYQRHWWFHFIRDPLIWGMYGLGFIHGIKPKQYRVKNKTCYGCIRFLKAELMQKSPLFCRLQNIIGPHFKRISASMLTPEEQEQAKKRAQDLFEEQDSTTTPK